MKNSIDIVIPTMWREERLTEYLAEYCASSYINKIILIDNDQSKRPTSEVLRHPKLELVC